MLLVAGVRRACRLIGIEGLLRTEVAIPEARFLSGRHVLPT